MTNAEIFRKAADYIREHGWTQGGFYNDAGGVCLEGAMAKAMDLELLSPCQVNTGSGFYSSGTMRLLYRRINEPGGLAFWNDRPGRKTDEVLAALDGLAFDEDLKAAAKQASELNDVEPSPSLLKEAVPVG